ncbi:MAG TPA: CusA/CzcA family heavy metal efflux RND transporter [Bryobacteraceae bacterium]|jgi:cobalt-zinc-cadmium resistance protein CzcA|nr:CusA/CzcA family heavy metal efflux RND transporter [Bryobacteraceae bacterium]
MINALVDFALNNRILILAMAVLLFIWGIISFKNLPVEAYPDVANNYVQVITQWPGRAAEEVEQQVTVPLEIAMNGIPHLASLRSTSLFGLSSVTMVFDDESENDWNRAKVLERLSQVTLPTGVQPQMGTDWSPVGQIYFYTLHSTNPRYDVMDLKSLEDWTIEKKFKSVPNVVDVSSLGGITKEYQVVLDANKLIAYGLTLAQVEQSLTNNNVNAGGSFIESGLQQVNVRAVGLVKNVSDIEDTVVTTKNGTPISIKDIATVAQGPKIRLGRNGKAIHKLDGHILDNDDVIEGIVLLKKGAEGDSTLEAIHEKVKQLNGSDGHPGLLPPGTTIVPFLDRSDLVHLTTHTVMHNLTEGIILVAIVLFVFLGNVRGAFIVSLTIPFALLFAATCLKLKGIPANLLSLGALDFGMVVEGAVVMVENIIRHLGNREGAGKPPRQQISEAAHEVQRPVFYSIGIIITAYIPIFTLQRVEGRLFKPMAWTVAFALAGGLIFSMFLAPVLASFLFPKGTREWHNPLMELITRVYTYTLGLAIRWRYVTVAVGLLCLAGTLWLASHVGSEFLPHLDEGAVWVRGTLAPSTGPSEGMRLANQVRVILASFPEVKVSTSQVGRPDDGTDTTGFSNTEYFVDLKAREEWRPVFHQDKEALISAMSRELDKIPGVIWNFSQPIADNMEEAVSGVKGELAIKVYGDDLKVLEERGDKIVQVMRTIPGVQDVGMFRVLGQPNLNLVVNRKKAARYQISVADVQDAIQTAVGGNAVSQVLQGDQRYDLVLRYQFHYRDTKEAIENIRMVAPSGERVSLAQLCNVEVSDGASQIYREDSSRYVAIKYRVRGRDLGGAVEQAIKTVEREVKLPVGYSLTWAGEYESAQRAQRRLSIIIPLTLLLIFFILYLMFSSMKWSLLVLANVAMAPVGGVTALYLSGVNFSVSSGVGFLALFGVSVQTGVIMVEYINQLRARGFAPLAAAQKGAIERLRPILMTMLVASLGLLPAATSHGIGSDSQRPFAIVIVGGLMGALVMSVYLLPSLYVWIAGDHDKLPLPEAAFVESD